MLVSADAPTSSADRLACPYAKLGEAWNSTCTSLPAVRAVSEWHADRKNRLPPAVAGKARAGQIPVGGGGSSIGDGCLRSSKPAISLPVDRRIGPPTLTGAEAEEPDQDHRRPVRQQGRGGASMSPETLRVPPHSIEAEQSVIGALLLDNRVSTNSASCGRTSSTTPGISAFSRRCTLPGWLARRSTP